ncbi:MAG: ABC transporter permease [Desulfobacteraceae bacterium]|nr:ABC transporter permease [Desulfobacteraceae bacterium]
MSNSANFDIIIEPGRTIKNYWTDLWRYRELLGFLAWRDILVRYKQTVIGVVWSIINPLVTMVVFTIVFGKLAKLPSDGIPYPILVYSALLPWQFFANSLSRSSESTLGNANLISKIYFPRLILPMSSIVVSLIDFAISFGMFLVLMGYYQFVPSWKIVLFPSLMIIALFAGLGLGSWFAALNVKYRDFRYLVPFIVQFGLFISPVGFSSSIVPQKWRLLYSLNPMVGVIDCFRWAILEKAVNLYLPGFLISMFLTLLIFFLGVRFFVKAENDFADVI